MYHKRLKILSAGKNRQIPSSASITAVYPGFQRQILYLSSLPYAVGIVLIFHAEFENVSTSLYCAKSNITLFTRAWRECFLLTDA